MSSVDVHIEEFTDCDGCPELRGLEAGVEFDVQRGKGCGPLHPEQQWLREQPRPNLQPLGLL